LASWVALAAVFGLTAWAFGGCSSSPVKVSNQGTGGAVSATGGSTDTGGVMVATGGTAGATGAVPGTGGSNCGPKCSTVDTCEPSVIPDGYTVLTDFSTNFSAQNSFSLGTYGDRNWLLGGTWIYPSAADPCAKPDAAYPLTQSFTDGNWHITGTVASMHWAGAGLWFATPCSVMDFSAYQGFSFTIAGYAGPSGAVKVTVGTAANSAPNTDPTSSSFTCHSNAATCTSATCTAASLSVGNITATPQTVRVLWDELHNGVPVATPNRTQITGLGITPTIDWSGTAPPYELDLVIDDLALIP
jgi:hypothetical protein